MNHRQVIELLLASEAKHWMPVKNRRDELYWYHKGNFAIQVHCDARSEFNNPNPFNSVEIISGTRFTVYWNDYPLENFTLGEFCYISKGMVTSRDEYIPWQDGWHNPRTPRQASASQVKVCEIVNGPDFTASKMFDQLEICTVAVNFD